MPILTEELFSYHPHRTGKSGGPRESVEFVDIMIHRNIRYSVLMPHFINYYINLF